VELTLNLLAIIGWKKTVLELWLGYNNVNPNMPDIEDQ